MLTVQQAKTMLERVGTEEPGLWMAAVNTLFMDLFIRLEGLEAAHAQTRAGARKLAEESKNMRDFFVGLRAAASQQGGGGNGEHVEDAGEAAAAPATPARIIGSDGEPLSDTQAEAERLMDAAAGPREGSAPSPAAPKRRNGGRPTPRGNGARGPHPALAAEETIVGADGSVITDPEQLAAERAMNEAAGPRS